MQKKVFWIQCKQLVWSQKLDSEGKNGFISYMLTIQVCSLQYLVHIMLTLHLMNTEVHYAKRRDKNSPECWNLCWYCSFVESLWWNPKFMSASTKISVKSIMRNVCTVGQGKLVLVIFLRMTLIRECQQFWNQKTHGKYQYSFSQM